MRQFTDMVVLGNGQHSVQEADRLRKLLNDSIYELGGWQQGGTPAEQRASLEALEDAVRDFAAALLGRRIVFGSYLSYLKHKQEATPTPADMPEPPVLTPELLEAMKQEAAEWRAQLLPGIRSMENLTAEDWSTRVK